ncbi:MAG: FliA/WhiG family RNA polymerase sigma factor [Tepidisphaeraceae bacterium]
MNRIPSQRDIKDVWTDYKAIRVRYDALEAAGADDPEARKEFARIRVQSELLRNTLMENYLHLVRYNAERIHQKLPDEVELDDLMSSGIFGLMDAIEAYDLDRGVKFETYCALRIRGAILDELRSMDWVPRLVRSRAQKMGQTTKQLQVELGREPTSQEIAAKMAISMEEFKKIEKDSKATGIVSLSRKYFETDSNKDVREIDILEDKRGVDPIRELQRKDLKELMTKGLSRAERLIIILYYFEEMTMKEIGATLDLSESRVSQMHSSIIARLRAQMADRKKEMQQTAVV